MQFLERLLNQRWKRLLVFSMFFFLFLFLSFLFLFVRHETGDMEYIYYYIASYYCFPFIILTYLVGDWLIQKFSSDKRFVLGWMGFHYAIYFPLWAKFYFYVQAPLMHTLGIRMYAKDTDLLGIAKVAWYLSTLVK